MIAFLGAGFPSAGAALLLVGYAGVGVAVGGWLARRGAPVSTSVAAIAIWPLLWSAARERPAMKAGGPLGPRISQAFDALRAALTDPAAAEVPWRSELEGLEDALRRADERVGLVDRLLLAPAGDDPEVQRSEEALRRARAHAVAEIEGVLAGVAQLRLQVGLVALAGDAGGVGDRLRQLRARVAALDEVARL